MTNLYEQLSARAMDMDTSELEDFAKHLMNVVEERKRAEYLQKRTEIFEKFDEVINEALKFGLTIRMRQGENEIHLSQYEIDVDEGFIELEQRFNRYFIYMLTSLSGNSI